MRVIVADGAMGTELMARMPGVDRPARLNVDAPDLVRDLHLEYLRAGATLLLSNTLLAAAAEAVAGVRVAREAIAESGRSNVTLAASLSVASVHSHELAAFDEADVAVLETVTSLAALEAAVRLMRPHWKKPIMATLSFGEEGTLAGQMPAAVVEAIKPLGLAAYGYGCGFGPAHAAPIMKVLRKADPKATLIAKPNMGVPARVTLEQLTAWAADMADLGIDIIGTCCGSSPVHTRAIADRLEAHQSEPEEDECDGS